MALNQKKLESLYEQLEKEAKVVSKSSNLEEVNKSLTEYYSTMDSIQDLIVAADLDDEALYAQLNQFSNVQSKHITKYPIPVFDGSLDEVALYNDYEGYFQRFDCINPDCILSWDTKNILFMDFDSNIISIITRPDVLMNV